MRPTPLNRRERTPSTLLTTYLLLNLIQAALSYSTNPYFARNANPKPRPARSGPPTKRDGNAPLRISNNCEQTIWPGIGTQAGTGAGTGGFELAAGEVKELTVSSDWQGRVWGRTNCSFNELGTGASNLNGNNGAGAACTTGDCAGVLSCVLTGETPVTLAEFDLAGGSAGDQVFYDISLVDGYNIPMGIKYIPGDNPKLKDIPPNLTNCACIATSGWLAEPSDSGTSGNASTTQFPLPYEAKYTNEKVSDWCPWDLQKSQPTKPGDGVYPYPDDKIQRPIFDPCLSACSKSNSPEDCCTGKYNDPKVCKPNLYSKNAKAVCPDAYSFAFDDQTSTFIIPAGGGWEIDFCPAGRSTNILATFKAQMQSLSQEKQMSKAILADCMNITIIEQHANAAEEKRVDRSLSLGALVVVVAWLVLW
ncbi:related to pathogenesis-related protein PR5K (thaumatin family) [Rhynchosporium secalis]|uniref:Related to pathogenesis-related protein PR5K (Thaumatin family) n=1 Tax=Rhynchosporium secalis TaxID=38038 RepID=A0A1E1MEX5_RHYSE|nr:related to pathogenesis-related protein PR5K (thaumatin family) [Rhynchosporium secalis]